jgi:hypothetical protein
MPHALPISSSLILSPELIFGEQYKSRNSPCQVHPCHHGMTRTQFADEYNGLQTWRVAAATLHKRPRTAKRGWSSSLWVGQGPNNSL